VNARSILLQVPAYAAFAAFIGYFSSAPAYRHLDPGVAVVKLSLVHAGELKQPCRQRTAEELAKLAPNMRAAMECTRERSDVRVEVEMDGRVIERVEARASGLRHDLPSSIYRRLEVSAGRHAVTARLADDATGQYRHQKSATVDLAAGHVLVIDFVPSRGGFLFVGTANERQ
jgi:hypothetical protein